MSDNKLVKTILDAAPLTGIAAGIGWVSKKTVKENVTSDPSSSVMNYSVCQIHCRHGRRHRGEKVSRRPEDSP